MGKKYTFSPPMVHPANYGSLQLVRKLGDKLWLPLANNNYICFEILETGRKQGLVRVTAPKDLPIIRGESLGIPGMSVNDWDDGEGVAAIDERHTDFSDDQEED